jgi:hypothetical protein
LFYYFFLVYFLSQSHCFILPIPPYLFLSCHCILKLSLFILSHTTLYSVYYVWSCRWLPIFHYLFLPCCCKILTIYVPLSILPNTTFYSVYYVWYWFVCPFNNYLCYHISIVSFFSSFKHLFLYVFSSICYYCCW